MAVDFLFICDGELSFLMNSLKGLLENNGLKTDKCDVDMKSLGEYKTIPELFIADADVLVKHPKARTYIYDLCIANSRRIVLIGDVIDLDTINEMTVTNVIGATFKRPINNNEVALKLGEMVEKFKERGRKKRILVVDDSPQFLRLMSDWLELDYNVNICPSATAAFHMIETNKPDLILLDYEMPICNGAQFLQMLHSESSISDIPVIFLTSRGDAETVRELISLKPQGYLLKNQPKEDTMKAIESFFIREMMK